MNVRYLKQCKSRISVILINILMILSLWVTCASWIRCVVFRLFGHGSLLQSTCSIICQSKSAQNPGRSGWKMYCTGRLIFSRQPFETFLLWLVHCFSSWTLTVLNHMYIYNYMIIISSGSKHLFSVSWLRQQKNIVSGWECHLFSSRQEALESNARRVAALLDRIEVLQVGKIPTKPRHFNGRSKAGGGCWYEVVP